MASTIPTRAPGLECRREIIEQAVRLGDFVIHVHKDRSVELMSLQPRIVRFTETVSTRCRNCWPPLSSPPIQVSMSYCGKRRTSLQLRAATEPWTATQAAAAPPKPSGRCRRP
jgi:hypothetical protein